jgi:radical SAM superfamily enzyme YgiQ (UPF0313 family)
VRGAGEILVVSCYELGRQPVAAATALAELAQAGFAPAALDVSVERLEDALLARARLVAISVPMHTALRLGVRVAQRARELAPAAHVCFFGLYATLNAAHLLERHGDSCIGGEADEPLRRLAESLQAALEAGRIDPSTGRPTLGSDAGPLPGVATAQHPEGPWLPRPRQLRASPPVPRREGLPALQRYAKLAHGGEERLVASVEATHGCKHLCRHCPIVPVYGGRFYALPREAVLADIAQQLEAGATHVTFGDPDFFNGRRHSLEIVRELHRRWPRVTFDATIKIEHLLQHRALLQELAACGCLFITSAVESLSARVLAALDKGHSAADVPVALALVRAAGIDLRPTLLPYTPWTELHDVRALFELAEAHDLVSEIDPVQYTLRLLLPPGSPLAEGPPLPDDDRAWLGPFDPAAFSWSWTHPDPRLDELQRRSAALAAEAAGQGEPAEATFERLRALALGFPADQPPRAPRARRAVPRLTEPWFC